MLAHHQHKDIEKLFARVILKGQHVRHTAAQARVALHQRLHIVGITRHYDEHIVAVVLHFGYQRRKRFFAVVVCLRIAFI